MQISFNKYDIEYLSQYIEHSRNNPTGTAFYWSGDVTNFEARDSRTFFMLPNEEACDWLTVADVPSQSNVIGATS